MKIIKLIALMSKTRRIHWGWLWEESTRLVLSRDIRPECPVFEKVVLKRRWRFVVALQVRKARQIEGYHCSKSCLHKFTRLRFVNNVPGLHEARTCQKTWRKWTQLSIWKTSLLCCNLYLLVFLQNYHLSLSEILRSPMLLEGFCTFLEKMNRLASPTRRSLFGSSP